ncbi:MAG: hypothetical protein Q8S73_07115 [Deltaproteobacteria bacterium]|nr:hypothetical protein [Myxococcales bacterium]MDP3213856.1 hypothetical protein [Deltaproteobacteria bacterium]
MSPATIDPAERIRRAQERALRAARAVTLTLGAALAGCSSAVTASAADPPVAEDVTPTADVAADVALDVAVAADVTADAGAEAAADAGEVCSAEGDAALTWSECCERINWDWNRGCQAWGPFMPPSMEG